MAAPLTPDRIIAALDKWKVNYKEYPGWRTRGRPGTFSNINGIMVHHTGGGSDSASYLKFLFIDGQSSQVPGPLCQFAVGATGVAHVGAAGRANHAGSGSSTTLQKVIDEDYPGFTSELTPGADNIDGNARYLGIEVIYTGLSEMTPAQYETTVLLVTALVDAFGWNALSVLAHREHTKRKWDPGQHSMAKFRRDVRDRLAAGPEGEEVSPKNWDEADWERFRGQVFGTFDDNHKRNLYNTYVKGMGKNLGWVLSEFMRNQIAMLAEQAAQRTLLISLASAGNPLTDDQIKAIAAAISEASEGAAQEVLSRLEEAGRALVGDEVDDGDDAAPLATTA